MGDIGKRLTVDNGEWMAVTVKIGSIVYVSQGPGIIVLTKEAAKEIGDFLAGVEADDV